MWRSGLFFESGKRNATEDYQRARGLDGIFDFDVLEGIMLLGETPRDVASRSQTKGEKSEDGSDSSDSED